MMMINTTEAHTHIYMTTMHLLVFLGLFGVAISQTSTDVTHCPGSIPRNNYLKVYGGKCLQFVLTERAWSNARTDCKSRGGDLMMIKNSAKQAFVYNTLKTGLHWRYKGLWLGGSDRDREGTWVWVDGTLMAYGNWHHGQGPTAHHGFFFSSSSFEDCAQIRLDDGGRWHDYPCSGFHYQYSYICEYALSTTAQSTPVPRHTTPRPKTTPSPRTTQRPKTTPSLRTTLRPKTTPNPRTTPRPKTTPSARTTPRPKTTPSPRTTPRQTARPGVMQKTTARPSMKPKRPTTRPRTTSRPHSTIKPAVPSKGQPAQGRTKQTTRRPGIYVAPTRANAGHPFSASQQGKQNKKKSTNETGVIVGVVVGGCVFVALLAAVFGVLLRRKRLAAANATMSVDNKVYGMSPEQREVVAY